MTITEPTASARRDENDRPPLPILFRCSRPARGSSVSTWYSIGMSDGWRI